MSYVEASFIPRQEYVDYQGVRLTEVELVADELYTAMFALASNQQNAEAAMLPFRLDHIRQEDSGLYVAKVALMNSDLETKVECSALFNDGYWTDVGQLVVVNDIPTEQSYLKPFRDDLDDALAELLTSLAIPAASTC